MTQNNINGASGKVNVPNATKKIGIKDASKTVKRPTETENNRRSAQYKSTNVPVWAMSVPTRMVNGVTCSPENQSPSAVVMPTSGG